MASLSWMAALKEASQIKKAPDGWARATSDGSLTRSSALTGAEVPGRTSQAAAFSPVFGSSTARHPQINEGSREGDTIVGHHVAHGREPPPREPSEASLKAPESSLNAAPSSVQEWCSPMQAMRAAHHCLNSNSTGNSETTGQGEIAAVLAALMNSGRIGLSKEEEGSSEGRRLLKELMLKQQQQQLLTEVPEGQQHQPQHQQLLSLPPRTTTPRRLFRRNSSNESSEAHGLLRHTHSAPRHEAQKRPAHSAPESLLRTVSLERAEPPFSGAKLGTPQVPRQDAPEAPPPCSMKRSKSVARPHFPLPAQLLSLSSPGTAGAGIECSQHPRPSPLSNAPAPRTPPASRASADPRAIPRPSGTPSAFPRSSSEAELWSRPAPITPSLGANRCQAFDSLARSMSVDGETSAALNASQGSAPEPVPNSAGTQARAQVYCAAPASPLKTGKPPLPVHFSSSLQLSSAAFQPPPRQSLNRSQSVDGDSDSSSQSGGEASESFPRASSDGFDAPPRPLIGPSCGPMGSKTGSGHWGGKPGGAAPVYRPTARVNPQVTARPASAFSLPGVSFAEQSRPSTSPACLGAGTESHSLPVPFLSCNEQDLGTPGRVPDHGKEDLLGLDDLDMGDLGSFTEALLQAAAALAPPAGDARVEGVVASRCGTSDSSTALPPSLLSAPGMDDSNKGSMFKSVCNRPKAKFDLKQAARRPLMVSANKRRAANQPRLVLPWHLIGTGAGMPRKQNVQEVQKERQGHVPAGDSCTLEQQSSGSLLLSPVGLFEAEQSGKMHESGPSPSPDAHMCDGYSEVLSLERKEGAGEGDGAYKNVGEGNKPLLPAPPGSCAGKVNACGNQGTQEKIEVYGILLDELEWMDSSE